jgi:hypothetical protein
MTHTWSGRNKLSLFLILPVQKHVFNTVQVTGGAACYCEFIIRLFKSNQHVGGVIQSTITGDPWIQYTLLACFIRFKTQ